MPRGTLKANIFLLNLDMNVNLVEIILIHFKLFPNITRDITEINEIRKKNSSCYPEQDDIK